LLLPFRFRAPRRSFRRTFHPKRSEESSFDFASNIATLAAASLLVASCSSRHRPAAASNPPAAASAPLTLLGTEWLLVDVNGKPPLPKVQATLSFAEAGRVPGNGSSNRFTDSVTVSGDKLKVGPLASTRMACLNDNVGAQEDKYLKALGAATRYAWQDPYLVIDCDGYDKPLRFTRLFASKPWPSSRPPFFPRMFTRLSMNTLHPDPAGTKESPFSR
jgi:heat shock protein HslJ